jgi:hypothetical protein
MAADQRYCLNCGHRRGEPRLPFMDAVVFMETMNAPGGTAGSPPPPPPAQSGGSAGRWNANAALIAGVATLVLAIGVGFLIGRSGHENSQQAATPQIIKVEGNGGSGGGEVESAVTPEASTEADGGGKAANEAKSGGNSKTKASAKPSQIEAGSKQEEEASKEATEKVLHSKVPEAKAKAKVGESCEKGTAGCSSGGEFNGNFFGE